MGQVVISIPLYKRSSTDKLVQWQIEVDGDKYRTLSGMVGGTITISAWRTATAKNVGKANEVSATDQATLEANAKIAAKQKEGYVDSIDALDKPSFAFNPMLAKSWSEQKSKVVFPVFSQPKLDGVRCWMNFGGAYSRNGNPIPVVEFINASMRLVLNEGIILDGELYNHEYKSDFNKIVSIVKQSTPDADDFTAARKAIQYHVYDMFDPSRPDMTFSQRHQYLTDILSDPHYGVHPWTVVVKTSPVADQFGLDEVYAECLSDGYEGQMVRLDAPYAQKRTAALLKRKEFFDAEYRIVDIISAQGGREGCAVLICETKTGDTFNSVVAGPVEYQRDVFNNRCNYIDKLATIKYQNLTPAGIPRFPVATNVGRTDA